VGRSSDSALSARIHRQVFMASNLTVKGKGGQVVHLYTVASDCSPVAREKRTSRPHSKGQKLPAIS
jgi:hypothetical protein